VVETLGWTVF